MATLSNIAEPMFWTFAPRLNTNLDTNDISLHKLRMGGGYNHIIINNLAFKHQRMKPFTLTFFMSASHRNRLIRKQRAPESRATSGIIDLSNT